MCRGEGNRYIKQERKVVTGYCSRRTITGTSSISSEL